MISFERNGKKVELESFTNNDVEVYLRSKLQHFIKMGNNGDATIVVYKNVKFGIYAHDSLIGLMYSVRDKEKMREVIELIKLWDKFSKTEPTFYIEFVKDEVCNIIFENGYSTIDFYKNQFPDYELKITEF